MKWSALIVMLSFLGVNATAQTKPQGDTLDGVKYHITIAPVDTTADERMPKHNPDRQEFDFVEKQPEPKKQVQPKYPSEARRLGIEGTVWVKVLVGKDGKVKKSEVVSADPEVFKEPSLAAARQWLFVPAVLRGKPVEVWATIPFRFALDK
jgi:TonB family protein